MGMQFLWLRLVILALLVTVGVAYKKSPKAAAFLVVGLLILGTAYAAGNMYLEYSRLRARRRGPRDLWER